MDEYIDILDELGNPTGKSALKSEAHKNGWYHNTIHVWLYTLKGEVLLQQRSRKKKIHPLLWDVSAAGHIDAGETIINAAVRETEEELGLKLSKDELLKICTELHKTSYAEETIQDNEFHHVYIAELKVNFDKLIPQKNEVESLKLVTFLEFNNLLENSETNKHFIASNKPYYQFVMNSIKNQLAK